MSKSHAELNLKKPYTLDHITTYISEKDLESIKFLHENDAPWFDRHFSYVLSESRGNYTKKLNPEFIKYFFEHGCPYELDKIKYVVKNGYYDKEIEEYINNYIIPAGPYSGPNPSKITTAIIPSSIAANTATAGFNLETYNQYELVAMCKALRLNFTVTKGKNKGLMLSYNRLINIISKKLAENPADKDKLLPITEPEFLDVGHFETDVEIPESTDDNITAFISIALSSLYEYNSKAMIASNYIMVKKRKFKLLFGQEVSYSSLISKYNLMFQQANVLAHTIEFPGYGIIQAKVDEEDRTLVTDDVVMKPMKGKKVQDLKNFLGAMNIDPDIESYGELTIFVLQHIPTHFLKIKKINRVSKLLVEFHEHQEYIRENKDKLETLKGIGKVQESTENDRYYAHFAALYTSFNDQIWKQLIREYIQLLSKGKKPDNLAYDKIIEYNNILSKQLVFSKGTLSARLKDGIVTDEFDLDIDIDSSLRDFLRGYLEDEKEIFNFKRFTDLFSMIIKFVPIDKYEIQETSNVSDKVNAFNTIKEYFESHQEEIEAERTRINEARDKIVKIFESYGKRLSTTYQRHRQYVSTLDSELGCQEGTYTYLCPSKTVLAASTFGAFMSGQTLIWQKEVDNRFSVSIAKINGTSYSTKSPPERVISVRNSLIAADAHNSYASSYMEWHNIIVNAPKTNFDFVLYRGIDYKKPNIGDYIDHGLPFSTSLVAEFAESFPAYKDRDDPCCLLQINMPAGYPCLFMSRRPTERLDEYRQHKKFRWYTDEITDPLELSKGNQFEVQLPATRFKVTAIKRRNIKKFAQSAMIESFRRHHKELTINHINLVVVTPELLYPVAVKNKLYI